ncbi:glycoside hydrolase family 88/105 protein [Massilia scottii]|uniref:glycoside hydrolase family 88/105 protein n=1 Tax=Massilia scottii TaxID=3057166 RepID=UPI002796B74B|nr:glycoside hydrolase family 88 protein [Massilia sp. CCM 9029]MDQ1832737.1 glycoside hydrolase family 88 protein [Massilia sp. CCM 9029]
MNTALKLFAAIAAVAVMGSQAQAEGPYRNPDNKNLSDPGEGTYPVPYKKPIVAEISASLHRIRGFMETATPTRVVDKKTGAPILDFKKPVATAITEASHSDMGIMVYEMGVVHAGMFKAQEVTGDKRFTDLTARHFNFFADKLPYFRAQEKEFKLERGNSFSRFLDPRALDDAGSMCAAMMRARALKIGPDLSHIIATCSDWVVNKQFRLPDGTMARERPQAVSLWADDLYMSVPALAELGRMTGKRAHFDDAVKNVLQMSGYLFNKQQNLYTHGWNANNLDAPNFYWARANGWAVMSMSDLLDVLPKDHPGYPQVLAQLRTTLKSIGERQSGSGLWHQMLDRNDSYLETSASAMFVYVFAHAINQGWISPTTYGSIAQAGWAGLSTRINDKGQVEGTCVGTTFASDQVYYYNRPTSPFALHGYGPTLLAGAEMIKLINNPNVEVQHKVRTYHYMPTGAGQTNYREHH